MEQKGGIKKVDLQELPTIKDRMTFLYLEHCVINRENGAVTFKNEEGIAAVPAASISALLLGPGTNISHRAMELLGDAGVAVIWVGEYGVRFYAGGKALTNHSTLLLKQAKLVSNEKLHIDVARKMYQLRFPNEDVSKLTMQQLRGREGSRIRSVYRQQSDKWGVSWSGREYDPDNYESSDPVNQSLSAGNACLYGLVHAVIVALGCSPGLGFVHVGHELSFVYDIADLYKADTTIPLAFEIASEEHDDVGGETRRKLRDKFREGKILERMVSDIKYLLSDESGKEDFKSQVYLWDNVNGEQEHGKLY